MTVSTTASVLAFSLVLANAAFAQTATPPADPAAAGAGAAAATSPAAPADGGAPVRGAPAAIDRTKNSVEMQVNAAGSAVATGVGAVSPGHVTGVAQINLPDGPQDLTPANMENGRWYNADGIPTFKVDENGELDYASFSGYRRYHAECHVCHGPDGEGSTYAPALKDSVVHKMDYYQFQQIVASGMQNIGSGSANQVMPAFGTNKNVWCYVDDIYAYLLARGTESIPRGRPAKKAAKSDEFAAQENSCMEG
ncbi:c-type cytochrome, methanol metabolism-related [Paracoccus luteus]|uniref:c-type cytochrome, methanol metabolism-related n=1 Tax=Paracoccus luteus TaxID=2508543 RepID=UPI00106F8646|nr:c-type cytochrome, methanol metabolism-related [Paracoccus luteus]